MSLPKALPGFAGCLLVLALLAACGGPAAAPSAPSVSESSAPSEENMDIPFSSRTVYAGSFDAPPGEAVFAECITSPDELAAFTTAQKDAMWPEALAALDGYGADFFADQALVLSAIDAGSGSDQFSVTGVRKTDGALVVTITLAPTGDDMMGTADMARFLFVTEIPAGYGGLPVRTILA